MGKIEKTVSNQSEYEFIEQEIQADTILPVQISKDNGVIPYQVQEMELKDILAKAEKYMPFLSEKDANGLSVSDKIVEIFKFRVPYYVGPLNGYNNTNSWMVRKSDGKITPWNFDNWDACDFNARADETDHNRKHDAEYGNEQRHRRTVDEERRVVRHECPVEHTRLPSFSLGFRMFCGSFEAFSGCFQALALNAPHRTAR